ncbi:ribonuclease HII [Candidatus Falkowbacteria bacterium]|nr:ribonuclease HII [Candidatus Falkowbacteria bacterium]
MLKQKYEEKIRALGFDVVVGIDEVGRGAWAGPIVAAGVIFAPDVFISGIGDSKALTSKTREALAQEIKGKALAYHIAQLDSTKIDEVGVGVANEMIFVEIIQKLQPKFALIDKAFCKNISVPHEFIVKGDAKVFSIAAASIIAKVYRDQLMTDFDQKFPEYGFGSHKGYGTSVHQEALMKHGVCEIHRKSYKPISQLSLL